MLRRHAKFRQQRRCSEARGEGMVLCYFEGSPTNDFPDWISFFIRGSAGKVQSEKRMKIKKTQILIGRSTLLLQL